MREGSYLEITVGQARTRSAIGLVVCEGVTRTAAAAPVDLVDVAVAVRVGLGQAGRAAASGRRVDEAGFQAGDVNAAHRNADGDAAGRGGRYIILDLYGQSIGRLIVVRICDLNPDAKVEHVCRRGIRMVDRLQQAN